MDGREVNCPAPETVCVLDFETTGLSPLNNRIIEVCAVKLGPDYETVEEFYSLIRFDGDLPKIITEITGIVKKDLDEKGREASEVFREFHGFIADRVLIGHNIDAFDLPFLRAELNRTGLDALNQTFDTLLASRQVFRFYGYSLDKMARHLGIDHGRLHNARSDVAVTVELYKRIRSGEG
jgi:DNA polymerase III epsilon subunit family exonuclease